MASVLGFDPKSTTAYGPDGRYGGFYTQADIREVVKYAAARHITVVPEIEMPGHSMAALAAYPQFSCTGGPFTMPLTGGIFNGIYNPANDDTFKFLDDVLTEVFQLFPGKYVHLGGDEVPKETWKNSPACQALMKREGLKNEDQLQGWFMRRIEKFVSAHGRTMIGWSEILQGGLAQQCRRHGLDRRRDGSRQRRSRCRDVADDILSTSIITSRRNRADRTAGRHRGGPLPLRQGLCLRADAGEFAAAIPIAHSRHAGQFVDRIGSQSETRRIHDFSARMRHRRNHVVITSPRTTGMISCVGCKFTRSGWTNSESITATLPSKPRSQTHLSRLFIVAPNCRVA